MTTNSQSCPLCQSTTNHEVARVADLEYFSVPEKFTYVECDHCGAIYMESPPIERLGEIYPANYYSGGGDSGGSFLERMKFWLEKRMFRKILKELKGESLSVLDVGGGSGWILDTVRAADPRVKLTAVVDSLSAARAGAEKKGHLFFNSQIEDFESDQKFDLIVMLNLIEHVADPVRVMQKAQSLLKPNGFLLVKTPNTKTVDRWIFRNLYWGGYHCPRHWVLFNRSNLLEMGRKTGFEAFWFRYTQGAPQWTVGLLASLAMKNKISLHKGRLLNQHPLFLPAFLFFIALDIVRGIFMPTGQMFALFRKPT